MTEPIDRYFNTCIHFWKFINLFKNIIWTSVACFVLYVSSLMLIWRLKTFISKICYQCIFFKEYNVFLNIYLSSKSLIILRSIKKCWIRCKYLEKSLRNIQEKFRSNQIIYNTTMEQKDSRRILEKVRMTRNAAENGIS